MKSLVRLFQKVTLRLTPRGLLAIDSLGALGTATVHGVVLPRFAPALGIPAHIFPWLAATAALYCVYSATMALVNPTRWRLAVRIIATANALFIAATLILVVIFRTQVTALGIAYFVFEAILVLGIAVFEWRFTLRGLVAPSAF